MAETAAKGDEYSQAMQLYHTSKVWQRFGSNLREGFKGVLLLQPFICLERLINSLLLFHPGKEQGKGY